MTYNLISSYIALALKPGDPRLEAAKQWALDHYRFDVNPGMGPGQERQGHFYYLAMVAKTWGTLGATALTLSDGTQVDWRADLFQAIKDRAIPAEDGVMWVNEADRWAEGLPVIVTGYMVRALKHIGATL